MIVEWDGPAWAAPESAERHRLRTEPSPPSLARELLGVVCVALAEGYISAEQFRRELPLGRK